MAKTKKINLDEPSPAGEEEDEGFRDAEAGRTISIEEVRKRLRQWVSPKS